MCMFQFMKWFLASFALIYYSNGIKNPSIKSLNTKTHHTNEFMEIMSDTGNEDFQINSENEAGAMAYKEMNNSLQSMDELLDTDDQTRNVSDSDSVKPLHVDQMDIYVNRASFEITDSGSAVPTTSPTPDPIVDEDSHIVIEPPKKNTFLQVSNPTKTPPIFKLPSISEYATAFLATSWESSSEFAIKRPWFTALMFLAGIGGCFLIGLLLGLACCWRFHSTKPPSISHQESSFYSSDGCTSSFRMTLGTPDEEVLLDGSGNRKSGNDFYHYGSQFLPLGDQQHGKNHLTANQKVELHNHKHSALNECGWVGGWAGGAILTADYDVASERTSNGDQKYQTQQKEENIINDNLMDYQVGLKSVSNGSVAASPFWSRAGSEARGF